MRHPVAITPEEFQRVYWTKVLIDGDAETYRVNRGQDRQPPAGTLMKAGTFPRPPASRSSISSVSVKQHRPRVTISQRIAIGFRGNLNTE